MLYSKDNKIFCSDYMEIYIPMTYFEDNIAINKGSNIETFGILYTRLFKNGEASEFKLLNLPILINLMVYSSKEETIKVRGRNENVLTLQYIKDSYIMHQTITKSVDTANMLLTAMLSGKLPKSIRYDKIMDIWWKNLEMSGISFNVPSKIYEMIAATIYRNPNNNSQRYGQYYGKQEDPNGYNYKASSVINVVKSLSTFSGMVFEDMSEMITNGLNNSIENIEEPVSPLEKIIYY